MTGKDDSKRYADKVAIATTTFYRPHSDVDIERANLARNFVRSATDIGYSVFVVDGGSAHEFLGDIERCGAVVLPEEEFGMGKSRRQAIKAAHDSGRDVIVWSEPEKECYVAEISKTVEPIVNGSSDLVVPKRRSLDSYPTAQQFAEPFGNAFWKALTGTDLDVWFGPRTWRRELSGLFLDYNGEYGDKWDSIFIPVLDVLNRGDRIASVEVDYTHPKIQRDREESDLVFYRKRVEQLQNLMEALENHWKKLKG